MKLLIVSLVALVSLTAAYPAGRAVTQRVDDIDDVLEDAIERYLDPKGLLGIDVDIVDHDEDIPDADDILELDFDDDAKDRYKVHLLPVGTSAGVQFLPIEKSETGRKFRIRRPPPPGVDAAIDARVWPNFGGAGNVRPKFDIVGIDPAYSARSAVGSGPAAESTVVIARHDDDIEDIREDIAEKIADAHEDIVEARHPELEAAADAAEDAADAHEDAVEAVIEGKSPVEVAVEAREEAIEDHIDAVEDKIEADIAASILSGGAPVGVKSGGGGKSAGGPGPVVVVTSAGKGGQAPAGPAPAVEAAIAKAVVADAQRELSEDIAESNADLNEAKLELAVDLANPLKTPVQAHREYAAEVAETKIDLDEDVREFAAKTRNVAAKV